ncbi:MAG: P-loop ATPase, Sll1717 family [Proteocatella sp.]
MIFSEENIRELFGPEAAEDENIDRLKQYYFKGAVFEKIYNNLPLRILVGHKGIGKSATFKIAYNSNIEDNDITLWIRPDDIMEICNNDTDSMLQKIRDWKIGLSNLIFNKVLDNVGLSISNPTLSKTVNYTTKLINHLTNMFSTELKKHTDTTIAKQTTIQTFLQKQKIFVYIDDLDRGWDGSNNSVKRISALLNAARDLTNDNPGLCIRISLRSDVYFLVRTSDESTDKIEGSVIWYSWTQHQLLVLLAKRIEAFHNNPIDEKVLATKTQEEIAETFHSVFLTDFLGSGKWANIPTYKMLATMIRRRPRDLVKICTLAAKTAYDRDHKIINTEDWLDNFDYYSQERIQDTINEYKSELPSIERLIMGMKPSKREKRTKEEFTYSTENLLKKIEIITSNDPFIFHNGKTATTQELAAFLYKINFLVAKKRIIGSNYIDRKYFEENKYLSNRFIDFGYQWEVHPAFRWALYPDATKDIYNFEI